MRCESWHAGVTINSEGLAYQQREFIANLAIAAVPVLWRLGKTRRPAFVWTRCHCDVCSRSQLHRQDIKRGKTR